MPETHAHDGPAERLLAAAARLFADQGYAGAGTRELCAAAGVTQPTLYYHFGNKEGLCRALLERFLGGLVAHLSAGLEAGLAPRELVVEHVWRHLDFANRHAEPWNLTTALYFGAEAKTVGFDFDAAFEKELAVTRLLARRAEAAGLIAAGREEAFVLALKGQVFVRTAVAWKEGKPTARSDAAVIVSDLLDGFRPRTAARRLATAGGKALAVALALGLAGCGKKEADKSKAAEATAIAAQPVTVREVRKFVEAVGTLQAFEEIPLVPKVDGRVLSVLVDIGDRVKPGQTLGGFDPTDFVLNESQAERALKAELAKLGLDKVPGATFKIEDVPTVRNAKARLDNAKERADRLTALAERRVSTEEETEDARANVRGLAAELDNQRLLARSGLAVAEMKQVELDLARQRLRETKLYAPALAVELPGIPKEETTFAISARTASPGMWIRAGAELGRVTLDQALKLRAPVPERFAGEVLPGQAVEVFAAARTEAVAGVVTRVSPVIDPQARAFEIEIAVPNRSLALKPGGFAKARVRTRTDSQAQTVPHEAVLRYAGVTKIFAVENGAVAERQVTLGVQETDWVEIVAPRLPAGTMVATTGHAMLYDGAKVTIRAEEKPDPAAAKKPDPALPAAQANAAEARR